jgi:hypothetical protein
MPTLGPSPAGGSGSPHRKHRVAAARARLSHATPPDARLLRQYRAGLLEDKWRPESADRGNSTLCLKYMWAVISLQALIRHEVGKRQQGSVTLDENCRRQASAGVAVHLPTFSDIAQFNSSGPPAVPPVGIGPPSRLGRRGGDGEAVSLSGGPISASRESRELARQGHLTGHEDPRFAPRATGIAACARGVRGRVGAARWRRRRPPWVRAAWRKRMRGLYWRKERLACRARRPLLTRGERPEAQVGTSRIKEVPLAEPRPPRTSPIESWPCWTWCRITRRSRFAWLDASKVLSPESRTAATERTVSEWGFLLHRTPDICAATLHDPICCGLRVPRLSMKQVIPRRSGNRRSTDLSTPFHRCLQTP